jgi:hypothetical protein
VAEAEVVVMATLAASEFPAGFQTFKAWEVPKAESGEKRSLIFMPTTVLADGHLSGQLTRLAQVVFLVPQEVEPS